MQVKALCDVVVNAPDSESWDVGFPRAGPFVNALHYCRVLTLETTRMVLRPNDNVVVWRIDHPAATTTLEPSTRNPEPETRNSKPSTLSPQLRQVKALCDAVVNAPDSHANHNHKP